MSRFTSLMTGVSQVSAPQPKATAQELCTWMSHYRDSAMRGFVNIQ